MKKEKLLKIFLFILITILCILIISSLAFLCVEKTSSNLNFKNPLASIVNIGSNSFVTESEHNAEINASSSSSTVAYNYSDDNTTSLHKAYVETSVDRKNHMLADNGAFSITDDKITMLKSTTLYISNMFFTSSGDGKLTIYIYVNGVSKYSATTSTYNPVGIQVNSGDVVEVYRANAVGYWEAAVVHFIAN